MRKLVPAEFSPSKVEVLPNKKDRDIGVRELKQFVKEWLQELIRESKSDELDMII